MNIKDIDFALEPDDPVGAFYSNATDLHEMVVSWRRTTCEQGLYYRDNKDYFIERYAGKYILLQEGEVRRHDSVSDLKGSRRMLSSDKPEQAMWLKYVDPQEEEGEHFEVYDHGLVHLQSVEIQAA